MIKIITSILILILIVNCKSNINDKPDLSIKSAHTNSGKYLSSIYSVRNGDLEYASKILSNNLNYKNNYELIELAFYSKLINGDFDNAEKFFGMYSHILKDKSFSDIPLIATNLKKQNFTEALKFIQRSDDLPGFKSLLDILNKIENDKSDTLQIKNIYDLLIYENRNLNQDYINTIVEKTKSDMELLLLFGFLKRKKILEKYDKYFKKEVPLNLSYGFFYKYLTTNDNFYIKKPSKNFIIAAYLIHIASALQNQNGIPTSYIKMLLEIANFINSNQKFSNFYLSDIYESEKNYKISLKKLESISKDEILFIPSLIKIYKILKFENHKLSKVYLKKLEKFYYKEKIVRSELALYYREIGECKKAIKIFDELLSTYKDRNFLFYKGSCLEKLNLWKDAKKVFLKIIEQNSNDAYALNYLSYSMTIRNEELDKAEFFIKRALKLKPNNGFFLDTLGWVKYKQKKYDEAIQNLQRAISIEPVNAEIMDHLGDAYLKTKRFKEALFEWNRAIKYEKDKLKIESIVEKIKALNDD